MGRKRFAGFVVLGLWAGIGAIVIACGSDDDATIMNPDGGADVKTQPTSTSTATSTATSPPLPDAAAPETGSPTDAGVDARAIWEFHNYCGDAVDAGCPDASDCPALDGGIAAQDCAEPFARCVNHVGDAAVQNGIADRVFVCGSVATPTWATTRICDYEDCTNVDAAACPGFDGGGVAGQVCTTPRERCLSGTQRVFLCEPNGSLVQDFNGYCDAGLGTRACNEEVDACAPVDGGVTGSACTVERERCYAGGDGNKIFVCAKR